MVAYSFSPQFRDLVAGGLKTQTVRAWRKRHAKPGEPIQLYTGMRTRSCAKLVSPDPTCIEVIAIQISVKRLHADIIEQIIIGEGAQARALSRDEMVQFAWSDGFSSLSDMGVFWLGKHGAGRFLGVLIRWEAPERLR